MLFNDVLCTKSFKNFERVSVLPFHSGIIHLGISSVRFHFFFFAKFDLSTYFNSLYPHSYWLAVWVPTGISILLTKGFYIYFAVSDPSTFVLLLSSFVTIRKHLPVHIITRLLK